MNWKFTLSSLLLMSLLIACTNPSNDNNSEKSNQDKFNFTEKINHQYSSDSIIYLVQKSAEEKCHIDTIEGFYIPESLRDSHLVLDTMLNDSIKVLISNGEESHFGIGRYLRNNWGLWSGSRLKCYFELQGIAHPDQMSGIIIYTYSLKLNNALIQEDSIISEEIRALDKWNKEMGNSNSK